MLQKLKFTLILLIALFLGSSYASSVKTNWSVLRTGSSIMTSNEVREYIENVLMTESLHSTLFGQEKNDLQRYQDKKDHIIESAFETTVKRLSFIRLVQELAIQRTNRNFFNITKKNFERMVDTKIKAVHQLQLKKGLPPHQMIEGIVSDIKKSGFPHGQTDTHQMIYQSWVKRLRFQLREHTREQEAFQFICTLGQCRSESPYEILSRYKNDLEKIFISLKRQPNDQIKGLEAINIILGKEFDFSYQNGSHYLPGEKRTIFLGKIVDQKVDLIAINDHDILTGTQLRRFGYPKTDDFGRTTGIILSYTANGTEGNLTLDLENWLFAEQIDPEDTMRQNIEEVATIRVTSRQFLDDKGDRWLVLGVSYNERTQNPSLHSWIQKTVHNIDKTSSPRIYVPRQGHEIYVEGIFGVGGKYSILKNKKVDVSITAEGVVIPNIGMSERSRFTLSSSLDFNYYGKNPDYPVFSASLFGNYSLLANGTHESKLGGRLSFGHIYKNMYLTANLFVMRWDEDLDRRYEKEASWTTGILLSGTLLSPSRRRDYEFN